MQLGSWIGTAVLGALLTWLTGAFISLRSNIGEAKRSGLKYVVVPVHIVSVPWLLSQTILAPLLKQLPPSLNWWLSIVLPKHVWHHGYDPFERVGADTFLAISPWGRVLWTREAEVVTEIYHRRLDFPKPLAMMQILNVFGPTMTACEGEEARSYRKIASRSFNETVMKQAWHLCLNETDTLKRWVPTGVGSNRIDDLGKDNARLTLHIISAAMYGKQLDWTDSAGHRGQPTEGHDLSFSEAIAEVLELTHVIFFTPALVLRLLPAKLYKKAYKAYCEWKNYMLEMRNEKEAEIAKSGFTEDPNFLDAIVNAGIDSKQRSTSEDETVFISPEAVLGNMFILLFAGHETTANTLTFAMMLLARFPQMQRKFQQALDDVLDGRSATEWSFEKDLPTLLAGYPGQFLNEVLRLFAILPFIPKTTGADPKEVTVNGKPCVVPANSLIFINVAATHRNPKYWGARPSKAGSPGEHAPFPAASFNPEQWASGGLKPPRGAFVPFSEGFRVCIGQRLAQVELVAVLARIFRDYSVELSVDEVGTGRSREDRWQEAKSHADYCLSAGVEMGMSLKMIKEMGLVFRKRGTEQWFDMQ